MSRLASVGGFAISMVLLAVVAVVSIPVMITAAGPHGWASIAVGQGVGTITAVAIAYGWGLSGPVTIAQGDQVERWTEYVEALVTRVVISVPLLVASSAVSALITPHDAGLAVLGTVTTAVIGLTASWYYVGTQQPWHLLLLETAPRVVGTAAGIVLMLTGSGAAIGLLAQGAGVLVAVALCTAQVLSGAPVRDLRRRTTRALLRVHRHGVTSSIMTAVYLVLPLVIISAFVTPTALAAFAVLDRVQKQVFVASTPFVKALQGWVPSGDRADLPRRARSASLTGAGLTVLMIVGFALAGGWLVDLLGAGELDVPVAPTLIIGAVIGLSFYDSVLTQAVLVPLGRMRLVMRVTVAGSVVGLALVALLAWRYGVTGGVTGMLIGLLLRVGWQLSVSTGGRVAEARTPAAP